MDNYCLSTIDKENFESKALEVFQFQAQNVPVYKDYIAYLGIDYKQIIKLEDIPFLPIIFFKSHLVCSKFKEKSEAMFTSSGTTGTQTSKHYVQDLSVYEQSFIEGFRLVYQEPSSYCFLALLPSYLERQGSSLIYMCDRLIQDSEHPDSGFYLHNLDELAEKLQQIDASRQKIILIGVSYALLDLIEKYQFHLKNTIVMETGGMKGQRKEMIKEEFYRVLKSGFGVSQIHSEYGMTELLSQAYSSDNGRYTCPPWMQIFVRDANDPFCMMPKGKSGGLNVIDLANINSCSFIATQDLGIENSDGTFSVLGRFDYSDVRGCNLMVD